MTLASQEIQSIESALRGFPELTDVTIFRTGTRNPAQRVVAVAAPAHLSPVDIRDQLWETVPPEWLPDAVVVLPALPRDETGQVCTDRIERESLDVPPSTCRFVAAESPTGIELATIWCEVLGRKRIGADDNFLDLGGDSMTAEVLLSRTSERFGVQLYFDELLSEPSLRAVAALIDTRCG